MRFSLLISFCLAVLTVALVSVEAAALPTEGEYVPLIYTKSPTSRLLKRSLCNTFGGCGTKRSLDTKRYGGGFRIGDEASEEQRYDADRKIVNEILDDIMEHLKKDQHYQQGKYVVLVPKRALNNNNNINNDKASDLVVAGPPLQFDDNMARQANLVRSDAIGALQLESN